MDEKVLVKKCANAINKGQKTELSVNLTNIDRTFGTILGAEITRKNKNGLADDTIIVITATEPADRALVHLFLKDLHWNLPVTAMITLEKVFPVVS